MLVFSHTECAVSDRSYNQIGDTGFTPKILERMGINTCFLPTIVLLGS